MAIFYPRKQTVIIFVISVCLVLGTAYYVHSGNLFETSSDQVAVVTSQKGTDNVDTSAIVTNSDWKKSFANVSQTNKSATAKAASPNLTQTDKFGRDLFTKYMQLQQANLLDNQAIVDQAAQDVLTSNLSVGSAKVYSESNISITIASDPATLKTFGAAIAHVMESYAITKNESTIIQEYLDSKNSKSLKGIDPIIATYKRMLSELLAIKTPRIAVAEYLNLINSLSTFEFAAENLRVTDTDPIRGLDGVRIHADGASAMIDALTNLKTILDSHGATFTFNQTPLNVLLK